MSFFFRKLRRLRVQGGICISAPATLLAAFIVVGTQIRLVSSLSWYDQQRALEAGVLVLLALLAALSGVGMSESPGKRIPAALLLLIPFASCGALSAASSALPQWAWVEWSLLLALALGIALIAGLRRAGGEAFDHAMLAAFTVVCAVLSLRFVATWGAGLVSRTVLDTRELSALGFSNRRILGHLLTVALPLLPAVFPLIRGRLGRNLFHVLFCTLWALAFACAARATFFGMIFASVIVGVWLGRNALPWLKAQGAAFLCGFGIYLAMFFVLPALLSVQVDVENRAGEMTSSSGRFSIWLHGIALIVRHPWFGVGPMHFAYFRDPLAPVGSPHNALLQLGAEWGLPALGFAVAAVLVAARGFFRRHGNTHRILPIALAASLLASGAQSLVDGVIVAPTTQVLLMFAAGWAAGLDGTAPAPTARSAATKAIALGAFAILALANLDFVVRALPGVAARQDHFVRLHGSYVYPRYWQQGWIGPDLDQDMPIVDESHDL